MFSGYYPSHGGGIEIVSGRLTEGLADRGYRVCWCALEDRSSFTGSVVRAAFAGTDFAYRLTGTPMPLPAFSAFRQIWRAVSDSQVVVIAEANFLTNAIAFLAAKLKRRPVLVVQHLGLPSTASRIARFLTHLGERFVARPMLRFADRVVYVSPAVKDYFWPLKTRTDDSVIGHGIDPMFHPPQSREERERQRRKFVGKGKSRLACFVGRCTLSKGIEIIREMARERPDWTFVIAGTGPIDPGGWQLPNVIALGHVGVSCLAELYRASDLLILPSPSESFSLVVREALACGTNVLCGETIIQTDPNLERYVDALPVDLSKVQETATRFTEAMDSPRQPTSEGAKYVARHCSWDVIVSEYAKILDVLATEQGAPILTVAV